MNSDNLHEIQYLEKRLIEMRKDYRDAKEGKRKFYISMARIINKRIEELKDE